MTFRRNEGESAGNYEECKGCRLQKPVLYGNGRTTIYTCDRQRSIQTFKLPPNCPDLNTIELVQRQFGSKRSHVYIPPTNGDRFDVFESNGSEVHFARKVRKD